MLLTSWIRNLSSRLFSRRQSRRHHRRAGRFGFQPASRVALPSRPELLEDRALLAVTVLASDSSFQTLATTETVSGFTVPAGDDLAVVVVTAGIASGGMTTVSDFAGLSFSRVTGGVPDVDFFVATLGDRSTATTDDIIATFGSTGSTKAIGVLALSGVDQTTPAEFGQFASSGSITVSSETGDLVVDGNFSSLNVTGPGSGQTRFVNPPNGENVGASYKAGETSTTMSWSEGLLHEAININQSVVATLDYGDAPDTGAGTGSGNYETTDADGGPSHTIVAGLHLGASVDGDSGTLQNAAANADDVDGTDDEDGVLGPQFLLAAEGTDPAVTLFATNTTGSAATLTGWIDYNQDGVFDNATERAQATVDDGTTNGRITLTFPTIPIGVAGTTYARFRLSTASAASDATGSATDGEVEDYAFQIFDTNAISDGTVDRTTIVNTGVSRAFAIASLGDLDGDGVTDVVLGEPYDDTGGTNRGAVRVLLMNSDASVKNAVKIASGTNGGPALGNNIDFGTSVASIGDLDGDGITDIAVGAPYDGDTQSFSGRGAVYVLFMNTDGTAKSSRKIAHNLNGGPTLQEDDYFGRAVTSPGDLDGDGAPDLVVGAHGDDTAGDESGAIYVLLMNTNGTVKATTKVYSNTNGGPTLGSGDDFGEALTSLGDLDGDGVTDLAAGVDNDDTGGSNRGAVHILFMNANGTVKSAAKIADGAGGGPKLSDFDRFGTSVAGIGDLDGDGLPDLAVGARGDNTGGTSRGAVYVLRLNPDGSVKSSTKLADSTNGLPELPDSEQIGNSLASLGDFDGDGLVDLAVVNRAAVSSTRFLFTNPEVPSDFGDAPDTAEGTSTGNYSTTLADIGPRHGVSGNLYLGDAADVDNGTLQNAAADADDADGVPDDEDGVRSSLIARELTIPTVTLSATNTTGGEAVLYGWIDYNRNGAFSNDAERAEVTVPTNTIDGSFTLTFPAVPADTGGTTVARFRLSTDSLASNSTGRADDGEVEDHVLTILPAADLGDAPDAAPGTGSGNYQTTFASDGAAHVVVAGLRLGDLVDADNGGLQNAAADADDLDQLIRQNFALNPLAVATQSSTFAHATNPVASKAIDGNTNGVFSAGSIALTDNEANSFWEVDLGADFDMAQIRLFNRTNAAPTADRLSNFRLSVFDGSTEVFGENFFEGSGFVDVSLTVDLPAGVRGDRVRVQLLGLNNNGDGNLQLAEVEVLGPLVGDEDGLVDLQDLVGIPIGATPMVTLQATNSTGSAATLYGWIDYNADGIFDNATERAQIAVPDATTDGNFTLTFPEVPSGTEGTTYARFRLSTDTAAAENSTGLAADGEVEDYIVTIGTVQSVDYGDAPDTGAGTGSGNYETTAADGGPSHTIVAGLQLGANVDADGGTLQNAAANADDVDGALRDDEDGVLSPLDLLGTVGADPTVTLLVTNTTGRAATLKGWIDYNQDGFFDDKAEGVTETVATGTTDGRVTLTFPTIPIGSTGTTYARFRLWTDPDADGPTGPAADGEVEDYRFNISLPVNEPVTVADFVKIASDANGGPTLADSDSFGQSVASLGDFDGDGVADLAVGAHNDGTGGSYRGAVHVLLLNADGTVKSTTMIASGTTGAPTLADFDLFGSSVASLGDLDGDGVTDLAVGAPNDDTGASNSGAVYVLLLNADGTVKSSTKIASGTGGGPTLARSDTFGKSLASLGDLDGDGVTDLAVGAERDDTGGGDRGAVYVLLLNTDGTVKSFAKTASGTTGAPTLANSDKFGSAVAQLGDLDGDGVAELAVGASADATGGENRGAVHVLFLNADGTVKNSTKIASGTGGGPTLANYEYFGSSVSGVGDLDGDGVGDLTVGAYHNSTGRAAVAYRGAVHVLLLNSDGTVKNSTKIASRINGGPSLAHRDDFGRSVTFVGDLDGDGVAELAVGANGDDTEGSNRGAVYILSLTPAPFVVDTLVDGDDGDFSAGELSLREAIGLAEAHPGASTITFAPDLVSGGDATVSLSLFDTGTDPGEVGPTAFRITTDVSIIGPDGDNGITMERDSGGSEFRLFDVTTTGNLTLENLTLAGGVVATADGDDAQGGAIHNRGTTSIVQSLLAGNTATNGTGNAQGGAVFNAGTLTITNSTLSSNAATGSRAEGGAVFTGSGTTVTITSATFSGNDATGGGTAVNGSMSNITLVLNNSILSGNVGGSPDFVGTSDPMSSISGVANLIDFSVNFGGSSSNANPQLSPLADNGGPTFTHAIAAGSPAIDAGDNSLASDLLTDQRGTVFDRVLSHRIDIGAFEAVPPATDFGDAPDSATGTGVGNYNTFSTNSGPRHTIVSGLMLGGSVDAEFEAAATPLANGDDAFLGRSDRQDDEDGVLDPLDLLGTVGAQPAVTLLVTNLTGGDATLNGWIDYNQDGVFDNATERAQVAVPDTSDTMPGAAMNDRVTLTFPSIPDGSTGSTYARFRLSTDSAADDPTGAAADGEVEDYVFTITAQGNGTVLSTASIHSDTSNGPTLDDGDKFGAAVVPIGDLDGDGVTDIAVGAYSDDEGGSRTGAIHLLFLNNDGSVKSSVEIDSSTPNAPVLDGGGKFGTSLSAVGDLDGDGVDDLAVGTYYDKNDEGDNTGAVHLLLLNTDGSIKSSTEINSHTLNGPTLDDSDYFGDAVASLGDLDGDGVVDIAVGASGDDEGGFRRGAVHIMFLNSDGSVKSTVELNDSTVTGLDLNNDAYFGTSVTSLGDFDGDGVNDIAVGAIGRDAGSGSRNGAVFLLMLHTDGSVKSIVEIDENSPNGPEIGERDRFGRGVTSLGDVDGDGVTDIAVGAFGNDTGGTNLFSDLGAAHVLFLNSDGSVKSTMTIDANTANAPTLAEGDHFGTSVASLGDLNGDGIGDLAVGAYGASTGGSFRGALHILFLAPDAEPSPSTEITLAGGVLTVADVGGANNNLTIRLDTTADPDEYVITDPGNAITTGIAGSSGDGTDTVRIPVTGITSFIVNGGGGDDNLTLDGSGGNPFPTGGITYDGGDGTDGVAVTNLPGAFVIPLGANGSGIVLRAGVPIVNFSNLEPIDLSGSAVTTLEIQVDLNDTVSGPVTTTISNHATAGITRVDFDNGLESVFFPTPTISLTITGDPNDADIILVEGVDASWNVPIIINGGASSGDSVTFQTNATNTGGGDLTVNADTVAINAAVDSGGGNVVINVEAAVSLGASGSLSSGGGNVEITGLNMAPAAGTITPDGNGTSVFDDTGADAEITISNFTVPTGSDRLLVVDVGNASGEDITSVTFDGQALTQAVETNNAGAVLQDEIWYLALGDGVAVTGNIVATLNATAATIGMGAASFQGVDQSVPVDGAVGGTFATTASTQQTVSSQPNDLVLDSVLLLGFGVTSTVDASQTLSHTATNSFTTLAISSSHEAGAASVDMDWTLGGAFVQGGIHSALNINAAPVFTGGSAFTATSGSSISTGAGDLTITFDAVDLQGSAGGRGALVVAPVAAGTSIGLGGGAGALNLDDTELGNLSDGFSSITIGDAASGTGAVNIDTATFADPVTIAGGAISDAAGTAIDAGTNSVTLSGTVAPAGIMTVSGDVVLNNGTTFNIDIGGTSAGEAPSDHDQLDVTGGVTIGANVTLTTSTASYTAADGDTFTIINNDGSDAVTGTFDGLAEGAVVSADFLGSGIPGTISYVGGDGNDVVITVAPDTTPPTLSSFTRQTPATSPTNADSLVFRATFNEAVTNVDAGDFVVDGATTATVTNVVTADAGAGSLWDVTVSGGDLANFNGDVGLDLSGSQDITDAAGNALPGTEPGTDETYSLDNTAPGLTSFSRETPTGSSTNADTLVFRAMFNEAVQNVDAADFAINGTTTATAASVVTADAGAGLLWDVTVSGGDLASFNGDVGLNLAGSQNITDSVGNALPGTEPAKDETYSLDNVTPQTDSIERQTPTAEVTNADTLVFRVAFTEAVQGVGAGDFAVNGSTTATVTNVVTADAGAGLLWDVTVSGGDLATLEGTVGLDLDAGQDITDLVGNPLDIDEPKTDESYTLDNTAPVLQSFTRLTPTSEDTNADALTFRATFSEAVLNVNAADFAINGTTTATVTSVTTADAGAGLLWDVVVSSGDLADLNGDVGLDVSGSQDITDAAGGTLQNAEPATDETYSLDNVTPQTDSIERQTPAVEVTNADALIFRVSFSEAVQGVGAGDFAVNGSTTATVTNVVTADAGAGLLWDVTVSGGDLATFDGTVGLDLDAAQDITDLVGNPLDIDEPKTDETYTLDNTAPVLQSFMRLTPTSEDTNADALTFRATFTEDVTGVDDADFIAAGTTGIVSVSQVTASTYDITISGGDLASANGTVGLDITNSASITDVAGNALGNNEPATDETYTLDNIVPTTTSFTRLSPTNSVTSDDSLVFRAAFSEAVLNVDVADFAVNGATTGTVTDVTSADSSAGLLWNVTVSGGDLAEFDGNVGLDISGGVSIADSAGNAVTANEPTIDEVYLVQQSAEYGDAPDATLTTVTPNGYPTLRADNGASHTIDSSGQFRLGALVDPERDGQPSTDALGDDSDAADNLAVSADEDGVTGIATIVRTDAAPTQSSVNVSASLDGRAGLLQGWIDFNRDGDWTDDGEQIFTDVALAEGNNVLTFSVPAGAGIGSTFARFRLSEQAGLGSAGMGGDGEVEDYQVTLVDGTATAANTTVTNPAEITGTELVTENGQVILRQVGGDGRVLFAAPVDSVGTLTVIGTDADDTLFVDPSALPPGGVFFDGGDQETTTGDAIEILDETGAFNQVEYTAGDIDSSTPTHDGSIEFFLDGVSVSRIDYTDIEPIIDNSDAVDRIFTVDSAQFPGDHQIRIADDTSNAGFSLIESAGGPSFESVSFPTPSGSLTINAGSGDNVITLEALDSTFNVPVTINGEDGTDQFIISPAVGYAVTVNGGSPTGTTGDVLSYNGNGTITVTDSANRNGSIAGTGVQDVTFTSIEDADVLDNARTLSLSGPTSTNEGDEGTNTATFTATLSVAHVQDVTFEVTSSDGTATVANGDYVSVAGQSFTIPAGQTSIDISVTVNGDRVREADEDFSITASTVSPADITFAAGAISQTVTSTITNDDHVPLLFVGSRSGAPLLQVIDPANNQELLRIDNLPSEFNGGVRTAAGDLNGDGQPDIIVGAGPGSRSRVMAFDGVTGAELMNFVAYHSAFAGGVYVASGDFNNDGIDDIVTGAGENGGPHVRIFDGSTGQRIQSFFPFNSDLRGGVRVAVGDTNNDGQDDLIVGVGPGSTPEVRVLDGTNFSTLHTFVPYTPHVGVTLSAGDINGDGFDDIVIGAGAGGGAHIKAHSGEDGSLIVSFFSHSKSLRGGSRVTAGDFNADGFADVIANQADGTSSVTVGFDVANDVIALNGALDIASIPNGYYAVADLRNPVGNFAPEIANPTADQSAVVDQPFNLALSDTFRDRDRDPLTLSASLAGGDGLPSWLTFNASSATFTGTPLAADEGSNTIAVTADDGRDGTISDTFEITVRTAPKPTEGGAIAVGSVAGQSPAALLFDADGNELLRVRPYFSTFRGGVDVAVGDINSDGTPDLITGAGPGGGPHVKVYDGATGETIRSFFPFDSNFRGGVNVGSGDVNNDGFDDIIVGLGPGGSPQVKVIDGNSGETLHDFLAFTTAFHGGVQVSGGDLTGDGVADIITGASAGGGPHVRAFDGVTGNRVANFFAFETAFTGGVLVSSGDVNNDGREDIIVGSGRGRASEVRVFDGETQTLLGAANPFGGTGGVSVAATDINDDGVDDIITGQASGGANVSVLDGSDLSPLDGVFALSHDLANGLLLAAE